MEFVRFEGEKEPKVIYTPYIYATVYDCHVCYAVVKNGKVEVFEKKDKNKRN